MKIYFRFLIVFILLCLFTKINCAYANDNISINNYTPNEIHYNANGGEIELITSYNDDGVYTIHTKFNTIDLDKGYYTAFISETVKGSFESFDGIAFNFTNIAGCPLDLNIDIITKNNENYKLTSEKPIFIKENSKDYLIQTEIINDSFRVNEKFDGKIIIPFDNVKCIENNKKLDTSAITLWGISITMGENNIEQFEISDFSHIKFNTDFTYYINGDSEVIIPDEGEFIYLYNVSKGIDENNFRINSFYNEPKNNYKNVVFKMNEEIDGVSVSEDGILSITNNVEPQSITIVADINNNLEQGYKVNLINTYEKGMVIGDDVSIEIPKINDLSNSIKYKEIFMNNKLAKFIRILIFTIFIGFISIIVVWMRNNVIRETK